MNLSRCCKGFFFLALFLQSCLNLAKLRLPEHEGIIMGVTETPSAPSGALFSQPNLPKATN